MEVLNNIALLAISFFMLAKGADFFVDGASEVATKLKIPQIIIGLTIVAMGTSAPEAAVSISAAIEGNASITIGNIVGSNILNILIILGISSAITRLAVGKDTSYVDIPVMFVATIVLLVLGLDGTIGLVDGIIFLIIFVLYLAYLFIIARKRINKRELAASLEGAAVQSVPTENIVKTTVTSAEALTDEINETQSAVAQDKPSDEQPEKRKTIWMSLGYTVLGLLMIVFGSNFAVDSATYLAEKMGVTDRFIGLTVVALGTSLPELFTSVTAAIKKNADIAIGNIVGSNIFNILFIVGISSLIIPVPFEKKFLIDTGIALAAGVILWIPCLVKKGIGRATGIIMLAAYCAYFVYLIFVQ